MPTLEPLVWAGVRDTSWACAQGCASKGSGHRWHCCPHREPGLASPPFPFPGSQLSPGSASPSPSVLRMGLHFRGGIWVSSDLHKGLPLGTGTVLTLWNPSETPVLTLESLLKYFIFSFEISVLCWEFCFPMEYSSNFWCEWKFIKPANL